MQGIIERANGRVRQAVVEGRQRVRTGDRRRSERIDDVR
jgi:hypothetical protein